MDAATIRPARAFGAAVVLAGILGTATPARSTQPMRPPPVSPDAGPPAPQAPRVPVQVAFTPITVAEVRGTGPVPVILIPEINCDRSIWHSFADRNADRYTMHLIELPGFGGSTAPPLPPEGAPISDRPWSGNAVDAIVKYIETNQLDRPLVIGASMGAYFALRVGLEHPDRIRGVVSLDNPPAISLQGASGPTYTAEKRKQLLDNDVGPKILGMLQEQWAEHWGNVSAGAAKDPARAAAIGAMMGAADANVGPRYLAESLSDDLTEALRTCKTSVLFIATIPEATMFYGSPRELRQFWYQAVPKNPMLTVVSFEDCRHFVTEDAPAELDAAIAAVVAGQPVRPRLPVVAMHGPPIEIGVPRISGTAPPEPPRTPTSRPKPKVMRPTLNPDGTPRVDPPKKGLFDGLGNQPAKPAREEKEPPKEEKPAEPPR